MAKDPLKKYIDWARGRPARGALTGIGLLAASLAFFGILAYAEGEQVDSSGPPAFISLVLILGMMTGMILLGVSIHASYRSGNRLVAAGVGLLFVVAGFALLLWTFPRLQSWGASLDGTAVKSGPIVLPGVVLIILVPLAGAFVAMKGSEIIYRAIRPKRHSSLRKVRK